MVFADSIGRNEQAGGKVVKPAPGKDVIEISVHLAIEGASHFEAGSH